MENFDLAFMRHALRLAGRNLGQVWPNPAVGAVVAKNNLVIGTGWTSRGGRPHAEPQALAKAGGEAAGATLYVTLEPCSHHGKTPPCTEAIIRAGIARVVAACRDPYPQVNGQGFANLSEAGIEVVEGVAQAEAERLNEGFFSVVRRGRPFVTIKLAATQDGHMTLPTQRWITGEAARAHGQLLRSRHDAILTGSGTVLTDDPLLTCRLPGLESRSPVRVVLDRRGRLPAACRLLWDNGPESWIYREHQALAGVLEDLARRGITRLMVEGGPTLTAAFLEQELADRVCLYRAPVAEGAGESLLNQLISAKAGWRRVEILPLGDDQLEIYQKEESPARE